VSNRPDAARAAELLALVQATPADDVVTLQRAGEELRQLRDRLDEVDDVAQWTPDADDGLDAACAQLGQVRGRHYLEWLPELDDWRAQRSDAADTAALELLEQIPDAVEREGRLRQWALPPAYYERAAIIYARCGQHEQAAAVCERYEQNTPAGTGGALRERPSATRARSGSAAR
jgi:hypothetical protein